MSAYIIKLKYFSMRDKFAVYDTNGNVRYVVKSVTGGIKDRFRLLTPDGVPLYYVSVRLLGVMPVLDVYCGDSKKDELVATVKKKFSVFRKKAVAVSEVYGTYTIRGDASALDFNVKEGLAEDGALCASVSKRELRTSDSYDISVATGNEAYMMLLCVIAFYLYQTKG